MEEQKQQERLEIYKLHADLADRVSQRRDSVGRLYGSLLVGLLLFAATVLRFDTGGTDDIPVGTVLFLTGVVGAVLAAVWYYVIQSYRKVIACKSLVLQELERCLAHQFYAEEESQRDHMKSSPYWKRSRIGILLPAVSFLAFIGLILFAVLLPATS